MPGTGMNDPMRKTISAPSRNSSRRLRSPSLPDASSELFAAKAYSAFGAAARPPSWLQLCRRAAAPAGSSTLPPAASIAARAPLLIAMPFSATLRSISPARITFARERELRHDARRLERGEIDRFGRRASADRPAALRPCRPA